MQRVAQVLCLLITVLGTVTSTAHAQSTTAGSGFQLNRYEPTAAGEWSFWVNHPWYSSTRYFAAGVTLNYAHNPLIFGTVSSDGAFSQTSAVVAHQLIGHVDVAGSFLDRVLLTLSLPVILLDQGGTPAGNIAASNMVSIGDLRFGAMVRLYGQPYRSAFSVSFGGDIWLPWRGFLPDTFPTTSSDTFIRGIPKLVLGGLAGRFMWSFTSGVLFRAHSTLGDPALGAESNSELQLGAAIAYANTNLRLAIGPEVVAATAILGDNAFRVSTTNVEALLGVHYNIAHIIQLSVGGGVGILRQAGTPDGRVLLRLAYAPIKKDEPPAPKDRDHDGVLDDDDLCPDTPKGPRPDPERLGCPVGDRDNDGVLDPDDLCPDVAQGERPDPARKGCPVGDRDKDGVLDNDDICPDEHMGANPDPTRKGCPVGDRDKDGVFDHGDLCPDVAQGPVPDPQKKGCPAGDRDKDTVLDPLDACPDQPGAPSADPKKNGCPGLVSVSSGQIVIVKPVFFATNKDVILKESFPVLESVADALKGATQIKKVRIEGHTDNRGKVAHNIELSDRRAKSVQKWLVEHGIDATRLTAEGYGPNQPIADNKTADGRAKNRRVDFIIIDPPQPQGAPGTSPKAIEVPASSDQSDQSTKPKHHRKPKATDAPEAAKTDAAKTDAAKTDAAKTGASAEGPATHHHHRKDKDDSVPATVKDPAKNPK